MQYKLTIVFEEIEQEDEIVAILLNAEEEGELDFPFEVKAAPIED